MARLSLRRNRLALVDSETRLGRVWGGIDNYSPSGQLQYSPLSTLNLRFRESFQITARAIGTCCPKNAGSTGGSRPVAVGFTTHPRDSSNQDGLIG